MKKIIRAIETNPYIEDVDKVIVLAELLRARQESPWFKEGLRSRANRPHSFISGVFTWSETEQGFEFWDDIYRKLYKQWNKQK
jgi:hypothetical protein